MQEKALTVYMIRPDSDYTSIGKMEVDAGQKNLSITGTVVQVPKGYPGSVGDICAFQYNAHFEAERFGDMMLISFELFYYIGTYSCNGWVLFENASQEGEGVVKKLPRSSYLHVGDSIIYNPKYSHRLEGSLFSDNQTRAVKEDYILMYRRK